MFNIPTAIPNLNPDQIKLIESQLNMKLDWEAPINVSLRPSKASLTQNEAGIERFTPTDLLDYIYAVLHTPQYRTRYKEFLKIDFPRVPFDVSQDVFWQLVELGGELRKLHLLEIDDLDISKIGYPCAGDNVVQKLKYADSKVWINDIQYFEGVSVVAWEFYIGGYQPAQKWLKDRKNLVLTYDDILHYQKIVASLEQTEACMQELENMNWLAN